MVRADAYRAVSYRRRRELPLDPYTVGVITLDDIFTLHSLDRVKLLTIDIEGAEHTALRASRRIWSIDCLRAEFDESEWPRSRGQTIGSLASYCTGVIPPSHVRHTSCQIPDY